MCNTNVQSGTELYAKLYPESSSDGVRSSAVFLLRLKSVVRKRLPIDVCLTDYG